MMKRFALTLGLVALLALSAVAQEPLALPAGTGVKMKLETAISTAKSKAGDNFSGRVTEPVMHGETVVIPVGSTIQGHIVRVTEPRRLKGTPTIEINPDIITLPTGEKYTLNAVVVDSDIDGTRVNDEGGIKGPGHDKRDVVVAAAGVGAGVGIGAAAGGGKGALIGAMIGGAVAAGHWLWRKRSAELPAGSEITMELSRPMQINASATGQ
jgi:hypothetical protein